MVGLKGVFLAAECCFLRCEFASNLSIPYPPSRLGRRPQAAEFAGGGTSLGTSGMRWPPIPKPQHFNSLQFLIVKGTAWRGAAAAAAHRRCGSGAFIEGEGPGAVPA